MKHQRLWSGSEAFGTLLLLVKNTSTECFRPCSCRSSCCCCCCCCWGFCCVCDNMTILFMAITVVFLCPNTKNVSRKMIITFFFINPSFWYSLNSMLAIEESHKRTVLLEEQIYNNLRVRVCFKCYWVICSSIYPANKGHGPQWDLYF